MRKPGAKQLIWEKLRHASAGALSGTRSILAVPILYENPREMALPDKHRLAAMLVEQFKRPGWIPADLSIDDHTPVAARELVKGKEIAPNAGLDSARSNEILSEMLADVVGGRAAENTSAIAFTGESGALGRTFFAILAS